MKMKILITVKTYPTPSTRYKEIVCTAGVLEDGSWIRLYPIDYRAKDYLQWYKKYQWVNVEVEKHIRDFRPESYRPIGNITLGEMINPKNYAERKKYVLANGTKTMCWLKNTSQKEISLAVVKPNKVIDFYWEKVDRKWKPAQLASLNRLSLFEKSTKRPLEKIPYIFRYHFICEEAHCEGHKMMIEDWEVMELYRKMRGKFGEKEALNKVKEKFLNQICSPQKDTYFFVGTVLQYGTWIIIGTFWPPKI